ncbi:MAG: helix-turn-helix domain-containing protein [Prevotella sp.]|nr:helix-turn-helix domain-containing protein [Prevotella sp.]
MKRAIHLIILLAAVLTRMWAQTEAVCPQVRIEPQRLPDLNVPRSGHSAFMVNGEVMVAGGHTTGFVLTPSAEYWKDGEWHLLSTAYAHDGGFSLTLKSGKVLLAGGFKENLGIGHTFEVEMYDPATHSFKGFGCLDQKRAGAGIVELADGQVIITGNWYAEDGMERFDGKASFSHLKNIQQPRFLPHLFRTSDDDVLVVAGYDTQGHPIETPIVEHMKGEAFSVPLLETWHPLPYDLPLHSHDSFIGDEAKGIFAYLIPVQDKNGQNAIAEVRDSVFSLLPTDCPVPSASQWGKITYYTPVYADRLQQRGYVMGCDSTGRQYALCIDYAKTPARLTLYYTDPLTETLTLTTPVMTEDGNLMLTGIKPATAPNSNFTPTAQVWLLRFNDNKQTETASSNGWLWAVLALAILIVIAIVLALRKSKRQIPPKAAEVPSSPHTRSDELLMQRICLLMDEQQMYLRPGLKVSDVASALGTNSRYVSECISAVKNCSFSQFVKDYRVEHAKQLLAQHPEMKISTIATESGFANDKALARNFKEQTGMTPTDWRNHPQIP